MANAFEPSLGSMVQRFEEAALGRWRNPSWWNLLITTPWMLLLVLSLYEWNVDSKIAAREKTATGVITAHDPPNHNRYGYTFAVDGKGYSGWEIPHHVEEPIIGQEVMVYYDPLDPTKSALTDFDELSATSLGPVPLLLVGIGGVAVLIFVRRRHVTREKHEQRQ